MMISPTSPSLLFSATTASSQPHRAREDIRDDGDEADQHHHDGHEERVAIADMRELVGDHSRQFILVHHAQEAGGHGHRRVVFIPASGKSIWSRIIDDINARHRQSCGYRQIFHDPE